jgi:hypothetical protein
MPHVLIPYGITIRNSYQSNISQNWTSNPHTLSQVDQIRCRWCVTDPRYTMLWKLRTYVWKDNTILSFHTYVVIWGNEDKAPLILSCCNWSASRPGPLCPRPPVNGRLTERTGMDHWKRNIPTVVSARINCKLDVKKLHWIQIIKKTNITFTANGAGGTLQGWQTDPNI